MDRVGFSELLIHRKLPEEKITAAIEIAERFEDYLSQMDGNSDVKITWAFCNSLVKSGEDTFDNLIAVARYGQFVKNDDIYIAVLELLDGAEAQPNLFRVVGETFGEEVRQRVFAGIGVAPTGLPPAEKPAYMFPVLERLVNQVGQNEVEKLLSDCLRDLPDEYYQDERKNYLKAQDIDEYLRKRHRSFLKWVRKCQRNSQLFYTQEITDEVVKLVRDDPEIESGARQGNIVYVTKIPYNAKAYLAESDPTLKRYYACHCPWARQAIKNGGIRLDPIFCNCSGGYSKKPLEAVFRQKLRVEVLESALKGDVRCRFAIYLPESLEIR